jgi:hypothetical protein
VTETDKPARVVDLGELVFAAIGVYVLVGMVFPLESMVLAATTDFGDAQSEQITMRFGAIDAATRFLFGAGLILARKPLARRFASDAQLPGLARRDILSLLLAGIGAWLAVRGASATAQQLATDAAWQNVVGGVTLFLLGAALFLGARGAANLWRQLRRAR